jgi:Tfp pilus assembly protein PilO
VTLVQPLQKQSAATKLRQEIETRQKKAADLASAIGTGQEKLAALQQELTAGAVHLESAAHVNQRIASVTEFFSACQLHVDDVQTGSVSSGPQYDLVPITIVGRGAYQQCAKLLHGVCSKYHDMSILRIDLAGNPATPGALGKFRLELFWYAAPSGPVKKAANAKAEGGSVS